MDAVKGLFHSITHPVSSALHPKRAFKRSTGLGGWGQGDKPGGPPTPDEAAQNQQVTDRIKRRRGVLANLFGGSSAAGAPNTATKTLLGS
jgi:hypothetical protein